MRTSNPALSEKTFYEESFAFDRSNVMTINGTVAKTGFLTAILLAAAGVAWMMIFPMGVGKDLPVRGNYAIGFLLGGLLGGLIAGIVLMFNHKIAPIVAPIYAICEGLFLGALSGLVSGPYQGIVLQAAMLTVGVLITMLLAYTAGLVRATEKFRTGVIAATGAVCLVYLASIVLRMFGAGIPFIHEASPIGIGFSVIVIIIAALNLVLDFDMVESGARAGAPKYMEWYAGYGLLVTLVWLYIEILRLLMKLRSMDSN